MKPIGGLAPVRCLGGARKNHVHSDASALCGHSGRQALASEVALCPETIPCDLHGFGVSLHGSQHKSNARSSGNGMRCTHNARSGCHSRRSAQPVSFFGESRISRDDEDQDYLFLPPPIPELVREGELGGEIAVDGMGRYGEAGEGRSAGWWAALQAEPQQLRASDLNELLQPDHLERLRYTNFPMQSYGALFKLEVLIQDALEVYRRPWALVAEEQGLRVPDDDEISRAVGMRPERAIQQTFRWTDDWGETQKLAFEHFHAKQQVLKTLDFSPASGALDWLSLLNEYQVPCCVCAGTTLDRGSAERALMGAGLHELCSHYVTAEDGCETSAQAYLIACIKVQRPPERCVVFGHEVADVLAAHDATAKAVAVLGSKRGGGSDLRIADQRVSSLDELSLMSLRELFKGETSR